VLRRLVMKNKPRVPAVMLILFLGGLLMGMSTLAAQEVNPFVGDWSGAVVVEGMEIEIVCHFKLDENGALTGTIDSPGQGAFDLAVSDIEVEGKKISFGIDDPNVGGNPLFEGTLDETGTKISGDFYQGEGAGTFELKKQ